MIKPWKESPEYDLDLSLHTQERFQHIPDWAFKPGRTLLSEVLALIPPQFMPLSQLIRQNTGGRFDAEAASIGTRLGSNADEILLANAAYDLALAQMGCSTMALPGRDGPMLARNMDWFPPGPLAHASCAIRYLKNGKLVFANAGWPASIGAVTGISARGFALALNAAAAPGGPDLEGKPLLYFLREVLEDAPNFKSALEMISRQRLTVGGMITLVGTRNEERVVIERSQRSFELRWGEKDQPLFTTNHFRALFPVSDLDYCPRYERLGVLLKNFDARNSLVPETLLHHLADSEVLQEITAQHILLWPGSGQMKVFVPSVLLQ